MAMVIRVRFKRAAKLYDFDPNGLELHNGMSVVTETARGVELGECSFAPDVADSFLDDAPPLDFTIGSVPCYRAGSGHAEAQRAGGKRGV